MDLTKVEIGRLQIEADGVEIGDPAELARSLTAELEQLLAGRDWGDGGARESLATQPLEWSEASGPAGLARSLAGRIAGAIAGQE